MAIMGLLRRLSTLSWNRENLCCLFLVAVMGVLPACHVLRYPEHWNPESYLDTLPSPPARPPETPAPEPGKPGLPTHQDLSPIAHAVVSYAVAHLGARPPLKVGGKTFRFDCSGFVRAAYYHAGIDLFAVDPRRIKQGMSGTEILYQRVLETGGAFTRRPRAGDLVFFDNTYDRNRNGKLDDRFTHVGIVETILPDGTVRIIHLGNAGIGRIHMNLSKRNVYRDPDTGEILNHKLRRQRSTDPARTRYLAAQLFRVYGRPYVPAAGRASSGRPR